VRPGQKADDAHDGIAREERKRIMNLNSMRKMAVTGLALIGMVLCSLGTVGCEQLSTDAIAQAFSSDTGDPVGVMVADLAADKAALGSKIHNFPPRSKIIRGSPP
jgi:hypothetical protein